MYGPDYLTSASVWAADWQRKTDALQAQYRALEATKQSDAPVREMPAPKTRRLWTVLFGVQRREAM